MGIRSGGEPTAEHAPLQRMLHALDMKPWELAQAIAPDDPPYRRYIRKLLEELKDQPLSHLPDIDRHDAWFEIAAYVDKQFAYMMATRSELQRLLQRQRVQRALREQRSTTLGDASAPTSLPRRTR